MFFDNLDEIVFKNKEKNYGAFQLRKNYHIHLIIGILISNLLIIFSSIFYLNSLKKIKADKDVVYYAFTDSQEFESKNDIIRSLEEIKKLEIPEQKKEFDINKLEIVDSIAIEDKNNLEDDDGISDLDSTGNSDSYSFGIENGSGVYDYYVVEKIPVFQCGEPCLYSYIAENIVIPRDYSQNGKAGIVYIAFIVDKFGKVVKPKILYGASPELDSAAIEVIREMPDWIPASQHGTNVSVFLQIPINFNFTE